VNDGTANMNQTIIETQKLESERQTARKWYRWLWLSPLLTVPTLLFIFIVLEPFTNLLLCPQGWSNCNFDRVFALNGLIALIISSLWHLVLLIPARNKESEFIRWHGRQGMMLAGLRTSVPLLFVVIVGEEGALLLILILILIWLLGNLWGQNQTARGDCSVMRWTGRANDLPGPPLDGEPEPEKRISPQDLVNTIRFSSDPVERHEPMKVLNKLGLVKEL
jgi:hypothetical protein